jgi:prophage antirepressor-like protein
MSDLSIFVFESIEVRFVGTPEKPEWVAADVCAILEIKNPSDKVTYSVYIESNSGTKADVLTNLPDKTKR